MGGLRNVGSVGDLHTAPAWRLCNAKWSSTMSSGARRILLCTLTMIDCEKLWNRQMLIMNDCVQRMCFGVPHLTRMLLRFLQCLQPPQSPLTCHPLQVRARTYVYALVCTHVRALSSFPCARVMIACRECACAWLISHECFYASSNVCGHLRHHSLVILCRCVHAHTYTHLCAHMCERELITMCARAWARARARTRACVCVHLFTGSQMLYLCPMLCTCQATGEIM